MQKDEINIESLYNQFVDDLFHYTINFGFDRETVMDAIHDVFYKISLNGSHLNDIENVKFYLFRSLKNRLLDIAKSKKADVYEDVSLPLHLPILSTKT